MDTSQIPDLPKPPEPEPDRRGRNTLWGVGKLAVFLCSSVRVFQIFIPLNHRARQHAGNSRVHAFPVQQKDIHWLAGVRWFTIHEHIILLMAYGAGRLVAYIWPAA